MREILTVIFAVAGLVILTKLLYDWLERRVKRDGGEKK